MKNKKRHIAHNFFIDTLIECAGAFLIALATYNVALYAEFPMTGISGISIILYRLFRIPLGIGTLALNIPLVFVCWKLIGSRFMLKSFRCMIISSFMLDAAAPLLPVYQGDRMIAALLTGALGAVGYAMIYVNGSSTGGMDFVTMSIKALKPHVNLGTITLLCDMAIILAGGLIFRDLDGIVYGLIIDFFYAAWVDRAILGLNAGKLGIIVTGKGRGQKLADEIDFCSRRGSTIFPAFGGYHGADKDVVMVAGSNKDMYRIQKRVEELDPEAFMIILNSSEVQGQGFHITRVAGG